MRKGIKRSNLLGDVEKLAGDNFFLIFCVIQRESKNKYEGQTKVTWSSFYFLFNISIILHKCIRTLKKK